MNYMKLFCKKNFCLGKTEFEIGEWYEYYSTFGGLNHFVIDKNNSLYPFCGPVDDENKDIEEFIEKDNRPWLYDYFISQADWRNIQIDNIIK